MQIVTTETELRAARAALGLNVGVVLTMGALHEGHLTLVRAARDEYERVLATIFVNPAQFAQGEDFSRYPRPLEQDLNLLRDEGVDIVFAPSPDLMYPPGFQTHVTVERVTQRLEGAARPGHFQGVATVVAKFFNLTQPATAYFGQKDAQQVVVIRRMTRDLNFPTQIAVIPTVREPDGLAMSSRNAYLTDSERHDAARLSQALHAVQVAYDLGVRDPAALRRGAEAVLHGSLLGEVEYVSLANPTTLDEIEQPTDAPLLLSLVMRYGRTRLLDNCLLPRSLNTRAGLTLTLGADAP
jgi:pantoate--beta-alanine ligase